MYGKTKRTLQQLDLQVWFKITPRQDKDVSPVLTSLVLVTELRFITFVTMGRVSQSFQNSFLQLTGQNKTHGLRPIDSPHENRYFVFYWRVITEFVNLLKKKDTVLVSICQTPVFSLTSWVRERQQNLVVEITTEYGSPNNEAPISYLRHGDR